MAKVRITKSKVYITLSEGVFKLINTKAYEVVFIPKTYSKSGDGEDIGRRIEREIAQIPKEVFLKQMSDFWEDVHNEFTTSEATQGGTP